MLIIPILLKPASKYKPDIQNLDVLSYDTLQITDNISNIQNISTIEQSEYFPALLDEYYYKKIIQNILEFSDNLYLDLKLVAIDYFFKLSYAQITSITLEDFLSARFLPDYHVIEYLAKEAQLDRYSVSKILVALSNLLRECKDYDVRQINAISLRIHKAIMNENRTVFVITEF